VTRLRADQLPADVRRKLGLAGKNSKTSGAKSRKGTGLSVPCPGRCGCGARFPNALLWEKHVDETGCTRWDIELQGDPDGDT